MSRSRREITVGLALCTFNEEHNLPALLESVKGAFDRVVLVDSYSEDGTVRTFREWCSRNGQVHRIDQFDFTGELPPKRNHALSLLNTDWECWADADDVIVGARRLRKIVRKAPPMVAGFHAHYDYLHHGDECVQSFPRERLWRRGMARSVNRGRVDPAALRDHDLHVIDGPVMLLRRDQCYWRHCVDGAQLYEKEFGALGAEIWEKEFGR